MKIFGKIILSILATPFIIVGAVIVGLMLLAYTIVALPVTVYEDIWEVDDE